ncbi:unnamed protein product, partial [marine sediment metagenome]
GYLRVCLPQQECIGTRQGGNTDKDTPLSAFLEYPKEYALNP